MIELLWRIPVFVLGVSIAAATILSAIRTFVLPRSASDLIARWTFLTTRRLFEFRLRFAPTYAERDRIMAYYAPISLLLLLPVWLFLTEIGFSFMFWAVGADSYYEAFAISGSSLLPQGFARQEGWLATNLSFLEAIIGLLEVALLIAYLPTMYSAFSQREQAVTMLEVYANTPPSAVEMITRLYRIRGLEALEDFWERWEGWFAALAESHTSLAALVFFRSPVPEQSWITAAGAVLDAAALLQSTIAIPNTPSASLCLRAGYVALRRIADFFRIPCNPNPHFPRDPISLTREEFYLACAELAAQNVPLRPDLEQAWRDFAGWRVNYDQTLLALCTLTMAPPARWSSDRAPAYRIPRLFN